MNCCGCGELEADGNEGNDAGSDLRKVEDARHIWGRIAGKVLIRELLKLEMLPRKRDKDLEGKQVGYLNMFQSAAILYC
jgi:hypothetical protein